ncbi:hypothetical protein PMAYCL1PPCAC_02516 [Pristionchus mayeri]|uniref:Cyclin N-terminal domain-containing protein n=1 Tax=Pristionchus mayeri TaxID=1317129 RepID=A0AAN4Z4B7_9BILA|nr:hypothetical protein PMAYCL1PPCAC_02516 [Pristionchus mayeri]
MTQMDHHLSTSVGDNSNPPLVDANFAEKTGNLPKDYIGDWIAELKSLNKRRMEECDDFGEVYLTRETVEYVFTLCIRLRMPVEVRFLAASIFDKFMRIHTRQMLNFLTNLDMENQRKRDEWDCVETNMSRQLTLRICSAIQIASKHVSYHDSLSSNQICKCLRTLGTPYTKSAVLKSEVRILKAIQFKIPTTQIVYAESVLKLFYMTKRPDMHVNSVWNFMCILLDVVLMERDTIYDSLIASTIDDPSRVTLTAKHRLIADWVLLACALVCAGTCCHYGFNIGDPVSVELEEICEIPAKDTSELAIAILEVSRGTGGGDAVNGETNKEVTPPPTKKFAVARNAVNGRDGSMPFAAAMHPPLGGRANHPIRDHRSNYPL